MVNLDYMGRSLLSDITVYMKYARYLSDKGRRETWDEVVDRCKQMHLKKYPGLAAEIEEAFTYVQQKKLLPSLRSLQFGGAPIEISPTRLYNCSFVAIDHPDSFSEIMFLTLGGTGVGYSVQLHHVKKLPEIFVPKKSHRFLINDSIEGWAEAVKVLINSYMGIRKYRPEFDFRDIRPKGALLKTAGGKAPGPEPLKTCLHKIESILHVKKDGEKLTTLEAHDICLYIADAVLAGGRRRSAMIALFSFNDMEMLTCKTGAWYELNPQRARANNTVVLLRHKIEKDSFINLWERIQNSGNGEPGFAFSNDKNIGLNPCVTGDTKVLTNKGKKSVSSLVGKPFIAVVEGQNYDCNTGFWSNGIKPVLKIIIKQDMWSLSEKNTYFELKLTSDHKLLTLEKKQVGCNNVADYCSDLTYIDVECWKAVSDLNVGSTILLASESGSRPLYGKLVSIQHVGEEEVYDCIVDTIHEFSANGIRVHNCAEVSLKSNQFCNLVTIDVSDINTQQELNARAKVAAFIATLQAGYTDFHYIRDVWKEVTEKDALIGVSLTGLAALNNTLSLEQAAKEVVAENKRVAKLIGINSAARCTCVKPEGTSSLVFGTSSGVHVWHSPYYIRRIRVLKTEPIYAFLVKHCPSIVEDEYFRPHMEAVISIPVAAPVGAITRTDETALQFLKRVKQTHRHWIIPGHVSGSNKNNISATVTIKEHEWDKVGEWMWDNKDYYTALSVLPYDGGNYKQPPFEEITKEQFEELSSKLQKVDFMLLKESEDTTRLKDIVACGGNKCELT